MEIHLETPGDEIILPEGALVSCARDREGLTISETG
jgi:hypothetical protein